MIMKWLIRIGLGILGLLILAAAVAWVFRFGPFATGPSAAEKVLPKVQAQVAKTQAKEEKAVIALDTKATGAITAVQKKAQTHAQAIRVAPDDRSDAAFLDSVCGYQLYEGNPACRGRGGQAEGDGAAKGKRTLFGGRTAGGAAAR